jgi:hypothetical protein
MVEIGKKSENWKNKDENEKGIEIEGLVWEFKTFILNPK